MASSFGSLTKLVNVPLNWLKFGTVAEDLGLMSQRCIIWMFIRQSLFDDVHWAVFIKHNGLQKRVHFKSRL